MKTLFINILIFLALIPVFDTLSYWFLPADYVTRFPAYRRELWPEKDSPPLVAGIGRLPKDYYIEHPQRGFDIGTNRQASHWVDGVTYPVWSNALGCFDKEYEQHHPYIYFAGDSFTWGYTPFEEKFGALVENMTGVRILKCGVNHTGQRHQYQKFIEIVERIGALPRSIFVFYVWNDVINDHLHPHSTVVDSWLVDRVYADKDNRTARYTDQELASKIAHRLKRHATNRPIARLKHYSLSFNLIWRLKKGKNRNLYISYRPFLSKRTDEETLWYSDNPMARENKAALLDFRDFAERNNLPLVVVLIPSRPANFPKGWDTEQYYREVVAFLKEKGIRFIDLSPGFRARELAPSRMFWKTDPHLNPAGNRAIAEILLDEFPKLLSK